MAFWGIEVKPGKPFCLKFDDGVRRRLHISQATLAIGPSKQTSLVQCNVGDKSPVLLCALLPDKSESLQLNLEFDEDEEVLFSVIGPRGVHLTGFYTGGGRNFNDNDSESYGEDIANSENEESVPQSDEDEYEDSFIDDDDNLEVLPPSPVSTDGAVEDDKCKQKKKTNTNKRIKKRSQIVESDDESISWQQNTENCIRSVVESDSEDGFLISSVRKSKKAAKNIASESNVDASKPKVDVPVKNGDPKRTMPKKKSKGAACEGKTLEADPANDSNEGDKIIKSNEITNDITFGQDPIVTNETDNDPAMNTTLPEKKGKGTSNEEKFFEADAADHCNPDDKTKKSDSKTSDIAVYQNPVVGNEIPVDPDTNKTKPKKKGKKGVSNEVRILESDVGDHSSPDHKAKKSESKTNDIAIGQDPIVTEIDVDPGADKRSNLLPSPELGLESGSGAKPKKKRKERSKEDKIPVANTDKHLKSSEEKKYLQADTGADEMDQDLHVGKENDRRPFNKTETEFSAGSLLPIVEEGSDKPKKKKRKRELEQKTPADIDLVLEKKADENTSEKAAKKKKQKSKFQKNYDNADVPVSLNSEKENSINEVQEENVISGSSQVRTLSNGLVIEDLESSKYDGKAAALGRKLKVQYTAKLKENGEIIDSNDKAPYRFRLGDEGIMEGWNIGLDGMRAGDKRRLVVPPSLGNGSRGTAENVPPDSWVIYDVELLSVR